MTADNISQVRVLGAQNHYVSHSPLEVHFGLGRAIEGDVRVRWPDGAETRRDMVAADQFLTIEQVETSIQTCRASATQQWWKNAIDAQRIPLRELARLLPRTWPYLRPQIHHIVLLFALTFTSEALQALARLRCQGVRRLPEMRSTRARIPACSV